MPSSLMCYRVPMLPRTRTLFAAEKSDLLAELQLREQIMAALNVEPEDFDRVAYDALWREWHACNTEGTCE